MAIIGTEERAKIKDRVRAEVEFRTGKKVKAREYNDFLEMFQYDMKGEWLTSTNQEFVDGWIKFEKEAKGWYEISEKQIELFIAQMEG